MSALDDLEGFFRDEESVVLANPKLGDVSEIQRALADSQYKKGHLLFSTSGTSGSPKWIGVSRDAMECSARMVIDHLSIGVEDRLLLSIPPFHVGGAGIYIRSVLANCSFILPGYDRWDVSRFHETCTKESVTWAPLVPTQLYDIVSNKFSAPTGMRGVLVGGGALSETLKDEAYGLGWEVFETYGMTETCSQIATAQASAGEMEILCGWKFRVSEQKTLEVTGDALYSFTASATDHGVVFITREREWFDTGDVVKVENSQLKVKGRRDQMVKILGERVLLDELRSTFTDLLPDVVATIVSIEDGRKGAILVGVIEGEIDTETQLAYDAFQEVVLPFERLTKLVTVSKIPRTGIGKFDYTNLENHIKGEL